MDAAARDDPRSKIGRKEGGGDASSHLQIKTAGDHSYAQKKKRENGDVEGAEDRKGTTDGNREQDKWEFSCHEKLRLGNMTWVG
jgi:hypothetical protein